MPIIAPVLLVVFLAAAVIAVFAFLSVVVWVTTPSHERQVRDRLALFKSLVEHPSENASQVLEMLRQEDERRTQKRQSEERRGWISGGLIMIAVGVGLGVMLVLLADHTGVWSVALIPLLIGCVLFGTGLRMHRRAGKPPKGQSPLL